MSQFVSLVLSVAVYAGIPLLIALTRTRHTMVLLYAHAAATLMLSGVLGTAYTGDATVRQLLMSGQVAHAGVLFTALLATVVGGSAMVLRALAAVVLVVTALKAAVLLIGSRVLEEGAATILPSAFFDQSLRVVAGGFALLVVELLVLQIVLEVAKRRLRGPAMLPAYVAAFVVTLAVDGLLFPALLFLPDLAVFGPAVVTCLGAKAALAGLFTVPLVVFLLLDPRARERFERRPVRLLDLLSVVGPAPSDHLGTEEMRASRVTMAQLLDALEGTVVMAVDRHWRIVQVNRGGAEVLRRSREDLIGTVATSLLTPEDLSRLSGEGSAAQREARAHRRLARLAENRVRRQWAVVRGDGTLAIVTVTPSPVKVGGETIGHVLSGEDVTSRAEAQAALGRATQREELARQHQLEAERTKNQLVATVSHELRTPITNAVGYLELLQDQELGPINPDQAEAVDRVERNLARLQALVKDLLDVAEGPADPAGSTIAAPGAPVVLGAAVESAVARFVETSTEPGASRLPVDLDVRDATVEVGVEQRVIDRVVGSLLDNAAKFASADQVVVTVLGPGTVDGSDGPTRGRERMATVEIVDSGVGMSQSDAQRASEPFYRSDTAYAEAKPGAGLGLSITARLVEASGGSLVVTSEPGTGTTVTVRLPVCRQP